MFLQKTGSDGYAFLQIDAGILSRKTATDGFGVNGNTKKSKAGCLLLDETSLVKTIQIETENYFRSNCYLWSRNEKARLTFLRAEKVETRLWSPTFFLSSSVCTGRGREGTWHNGHTTFQHLWPVLKRKSHLQSCFYLSVSSRCKLFCFVLVGLTAFSPFVLVKCRVMSNFKKITKRKTTSLENNL